MSTINLSLSQLRAALCIAAKQDIRYYLNGVYVECDSIRTRVVGTNGHMLYVEDYMPGEPNTWQGTMIVPRAILEMVTKGFHNLDVAWITVKEQDDTGHVTRATIKTGAVMNDIEFAAINGVFPDYTRVIPSAVETPVPAQFNPEYIALFAKVAKVHGQKNGAFHLHHNGNGGALVTFSNNTNAIGVLMPLRDSADFPDTGTFRERIYTAPKVEAKTDAETTASE